MARNSVVAPAIIIVLALSLDMDPTDSVVVAGAAFSVGFGASRTFGGYRWGAAIVIGRIFRL
ncbi:hypothetical protein [Exercitatus varius]|uniref:Uncharacterized protein n=1 Tax=Exercitatus varius TaxID=67857 RepID=A0AAW6QA89_9PAST|nr:hypothetical protein [Exercitatus varius]MDG2949048.1 hypothetical protein [Exercitatus varius]